MTFVVFSLPRSRSAWLSAFLGSPERPVAHDLGVTCSSPAEFAERLRTEVAGTCETGAAFAAPLIRKMVPGVRFVTVRRPIDEVIESLARCGITGVDEEMLLRARQLSEIERDHDVLRIDYHDLIKPSVCAQVFQFCAGRPMPGAWWAVMDPLNIQVDMVRQLALLARNRPQIEALKAQAMEMMADA